LNKNSKQAIKRRLLYFIKIKIRCQQINFIFFDHSNELVIRSSNDINYTGISSYRQHLLQKKIKFFTYPNFYNYSCKNIRFSTANKKTIHYIRSPFL